MEISLYIVIIIIEIYTLGWSVKIYIYRDVKNNEDLIIIKEYSTGWPWLSDNGDPNFRRFNLSRESCCKWSSDWNAYRSILMP